MKKLLVLAFVLPLLASCSQAAVEDAISQGADKITALGAEAAAEALRVALVSEAKSQGLSPTSVTLLEQVADTVPGVTLSYFDADANDLVDKGVVTVTALGKSACLILPSPAAPGNVIPGACV
jgi:hypothetical protein